MIAQRKNNILLLKIPENNVSNSAQILNIYNLIIVKIIALKIMLIQ